MPHPLVWNGLISRDFILRHNISFGIDSWPREDLVFHLDFINHDFRGLYISEETYVYRLAVNGSLSNSYSLRGICNLTNILEAINRALAKTSGSDLTEIIKEEQKNTFNSILRLLPRVPKEIRKTLLQSKSLKNVPVKTSTEGLVSHIIGAAYHISSSLAYAVSSVMACAVPESKRITK